MPVLEVILQVLHDRISLNPAMSKYASAPDHGYFLPANNFTDVFGGHPRCLFDRKSATVISSHGIRVACTLVKKYGLCRCSEPRFVSS